MVTSSMTSIGIAIKDARKKHKIEQQKLASELGISNEYLCRIENGKLTNYSVDILIRICERLDITIL
jgi:transcriptional regulator with XRE-family HTH domain